VRRSVLLAVAVALLATGCGDEASYSRAETRACLARSHVRIGGKLDFVASTATDGAFVAHLGDGNFATILFGENEGDAEELENAYQRFAFPNVKEGLPDVLRRDRNAVLLWHEHPSDAAVATISDCLK
jgi:hypothetical protein